ncbi:MAG: serine/threonine protein kinase [Myxococcales bacterium]|nr:serine/threonine protein kinase [Myxococcales bacterium]
MTERTGATRSDVADPLIGRTINDRFRITRLIARGGMGKVYLAEQSPLGRLCAIKVLNPSYNGGAEPEFHKRFFLEASVTSRLSHPNTVTIFDYGVTEDDYYFMAMEYLEGQTLYQAIRRDGFITEERAVNIVSQICRGLREAHAIGVIHRDLKPANIFLVKHGDESDFVKILDFGLVKNVLEKAEDQITQTGLFMGSPKYMAPEQIHGAAVDARTDIYSLGVVLCELLTGKVPFDRATSVSILMAHVSESPPPLAELKPDIVASIEVEDIVHRCLAKNPDDRYASMDDLLLALRVAAGVSVTGQVSAFPLGAGASGSQRVVRRAAASGSGGIAIRQAPAVVASAAPQSQTPLSLSHDEVPGARRGARRSTCCRWRSRSPPRPAVWAGSQRTSCRCPRRHRSRGPSWPPRNLRPRPRRARRRPPRPRAPPKSARRSSRSSPSRLARASAATASSSARPPRAASC